MHDRISLRIAEADDTAVAHLAALDSNPEFAGPALVAERDGVAVAAIAYDGSAVVADPFLRTAGVVALLAERSAQLRGVRVADRRRAWRRGVRSQRRLSVGVAPPALRPRLAGR